MTNNNITSNFKFSASERECFTLSLDEIFDGIYEDYTSYSHGNTAGIEIPKKLEEPRLIHSCILYAEGLRLAHTHLELAKKLISVSLCNLNLRSADWLRANGEAKQVEKLLQRIADFENAKAKEREKEEKRKFAVMAE